MTSFHETSKTTESFKVICPIGYPIPPTISPMLWLHQTTSSYPNMSYCLMPLWFHICCPLFLGYSPSSSTTNMLIFIYSLKLLRHCPPRKAFSQPLEWFMSPKHSIFPSTALIHCLRSLRNYESSFLIPVLPST